MFGFLPAIGFYLFRDHGPGPKHVKKTYPEYGVDMNNY